MAAIDAILQDLTELNKGNILLELKQEHYKDGKAPEHAIQATKDQLLKKNVSKIKMCNNCHQPYKPKGNAQKYCDSCRIIIKKDLIKLRAENNHVSRKERICEKCGQPFIPSGNRQKYCSIDCGLHPREKRVKKKIPEYYKVIQGGFSEDTEHSNDSYDLSKNNKMTEILNDNTQVSAEPITKEEIIQGIEQIKNESIDNDGDNPYLTIKKINKQA